MRTWSPTSITDRSLLASTFEAWKPVTLCRRTADPSGIGQELAADEDRTTLQPDFTPEAASKAEAPRIATIEGAEGGYSCGRDAVYTLRPGIDAQLDEIALSGDYGYKYIEDFDTFEQLLCSWGTFVEHAYTKGWGITIDMG